MSDPAAGRLGSRCPACGSELPAAFPGATVTCTCGHRVALTAAQEVARSGGPGGPYRAPGSAARPLSSTVPCPFCGNDCPALVRICPCCDVRLDNVRCQRCFSLQVPGAFACARCDHPLELEPLLDATDAPCPRCNHPLEVAPGADTRVHECPRCGGMFVPRDVLAEILCGAEAGSGLREGAPRRAPAVELEVRYLPCPLCHATMNRVNFGKVSGVIVDVCKAHGTWFDMGELTRTIAFAAAGGMERTRAREQEEAEAQAARARSDKLQANLGASLAVRSREDPRLEAWRELLASVLFW